MDKVRSLYLELLRIIAALYVFLYHFGSEKLGDKMYFSTPEFNKKIGLKYLGAHYFVIVFFVLSGFLITMSVCKSKVTLKSFFIARLGRLYSVLLPALIFSYIVSFILVHTVTLINDIYSYDHLAIRFLLNITFLTQTWTLCATPPLNTPFWSVNYEFIYYAIIATIVLIKKPIRKIICLILLFLIAWPKVMFLAPAWFAGSLLFFVQDRVKFDKKLSYLSFVITLFCIILVLSNPKMMPLSKNTNTNNLFNFNLLYSWNYQADFLFALLIAANIYFLFIISSSINKMLSEKTMNIFYNLTRKIGNCSYTLYLFHLPLLFFYATVFPYNKTNQVHQAGIICLVIISVFFIAKYTEWKIEFWRLLMQKLFNMGTKLINYFILKERKTFISK